MIGEFIREIRPHGGTAVWRPREKVAFYKPRKEASEETSPASTLISDFQPPGLWENKCSLFETPSPWYFVMAALEN